jgi:anti-sigma B factor antagonist
MEVNMAEFSLFEYQINKENSSIAIINLGHNLLGGNEALSFTSTIHELITQKIKLVIINLAEVELMNSSGLGMLVGVLSTLKKNDINLFLVSVPEKVNSLLVMTHLDKVFKCYNNIDEAIKNFN